MTIGAVFSATCAATLGGSPANGNHQQNGNGEVCPKGSYEFQMPLHYPRYNKSDYEKMPEWQLDGLLRQYGLPVAGDVTHKRNYAIGAFPWPDQL